MEEQLSVTQMKNRLDAAGYAPIYNDTRSLILALSGLTETVLDDMAIAMEADYEVFLSDYVGPYLPDAHIGMLALLNEWGPFPWPDLGGSSLNGLTGAQFFLAWAWRENDAANRCLGGEAAASGWRPEDALDCGLIAAVSAAKSVSHAKSQLTLS